MTFTETATILRQFNEWRRGADGLPPHRNDITEAIDVAVEIFGMGPSGPSPRLESFALCHGLASGV